MTVPLSILASFISNDNDAVDGNINWYHLCMVMPIAVHGSYDALARAHHEPYGAIQVVHPAWSRLLV